MIIRYAAAFALVAAISSQASAQSPPQAKLGMDGAAEEFRDRMIYEAVAWKDMLDHCKSKDAAVLLRKLGRDNGLYAWWEWKTPEVSEPQEGNLQSCRKSALGARYALNDYAEGNLEGYRLSLSTYTREWPKCAQAFPAAAKAMRKAYSKNPLRPD